MSLIITFALCFGFVFLFLTFKVFQAMKRKLETGREGLVGEVGVARTDIDSRSGKVFVHGEWWNAISDAAIPAGSRVPVEAVNNLQLKVKISGG